MITENKYFIFDIPEKKNRYYRHLVTHWIKNIIYKIKLEIYKPEKILSKKYYISICAIFKNEAPYIKEWIEYHKITGVQHFYLYNNFSSDTYKNILEPYINNGEVTLIDWPIAQGQMSAYKHCVDNFSNDTNWIAFIDLDEFIVPNREDTIIPLLKRFESNRPVVIAYWKMFGTSGNIDKDPDKFIIERFVVCWRKYTNIGKFFFNTAYDYANELKENSAMHIHWAKYKGHRLPPVNFDDNVICSGINKVENAIPSVQINHYFTKSYEEYLDKKSRGDAFFALNPRDEDYFFFHEMKCQSTDYSAYKYLIKIKQNFKYSKK